MTYEYSYSLKSPKLGEKSFQVLFTFTQIILDPFKSSRHPAWINWKEHYFRDYLAEEQVPTPYYFVSTRIQNELFRKYLKHYWDRGKGYEEFCTCVPNRGKGFRGIYTCLEGGLPISFRYFHPLSPASLWEACHISLRHIAFLCLRHRYPRIFYEIGSIIF